MASRPQQQGDTDVLPIGEAQLVVTNALLVKTQAVLDAASAEVGTKIDPDNIAVTELPNTLVIQIAVQDHDPNQAAAIANALVTSLIQKNQELLSGRYAELEATLSEQVVQVEGQIADLQAQFTSLNGASIREQLTQVNAQIDQA